LKGACRPRFFKRTAGVEPGPRALPAQNLSLRQVILLRVFLRQAPGVELRDQRDHRPPDYLPVKQMVGAGALTFFLRSNSLALEFDSSPSFCYYHTAFWMSLKLQLDGEAWSAVLADMSRALGKKGSPVRLCLIGSAACLFGGMDGRTSADLDIWKPASDYDRQELKTAAEKAGLFFDPKQTLDPARPYLQLVEPGLTQLGAFEPVFIERIGRLQLYRPPVENLIAAKLIRAEPKDLGDIRFLVSRHRPDLKRVRQIIAEFNPQARERATENLVYLDVLET
jgi:hypothetical protein